MTNAPDLNRPVLEPVENMALTIALAQIRRGDEVTPNTTATLILPAGVITENGRPLLESKGVKIVSDRVGHSNFKLESGQYYFLFRSGTQQSRVGDN